ncbi:hypothetical protein A3I48_00470 [Candidatus Daviesbacteria bacterium RIFCSPLOWO2_02_FULL_36_7]|uniref:Uncharacterized protein n=1 Tax=Candidatus Daviesbacteria bacterium RIFCSPLOWO2_02_FULL_36_7 TaxID=1797792 RepID=A0A1F5MGK9_9BACT|nr:MAG: hypothetical protein A3I48_00470 [Candidatus Daviesbacteria bacterium RIFCSPLOWO2_02_FULL_36_7]
MSDYYYIDDKESDFGYIPVLGDDFVAAILSIAKRRGVKITDEMILNEIFHKKKKGIKKAKGK